MADIVLLADPKTSAWNFAKNIQNYIKTTKEKEIPLNELEMIKFNNNEILPHVLENIRQKDVYYIQSSANKMPNDWVMELILIKDLCMSADVNNLIYVLPFMNYARQDRKDRSRVPISTRAVAGAISPGLKRIITMDLHSAQIENAYHIPLDNLHSFPSLVDHFVKNHTSDLENLAIVSPDVGGGSRARSLFNRFSSLKLPDSSKKSNYSFALIFKTRDKPGSIEDMQLIGDVKDKSVLVVDDMYDTCNTNVKAAELLRNSGAKKLMTYATHGLFTKGIDKILSNYDTVITSNTHYMPKKKDVGKIEIIDMAPTFAEAIYRAHEGLSVSKLFE
jgi:ribose-phosphate pyrophosphokinase